MKLLIVLPKLAGAGAEIFVSRLALSLSRKGVEVRIYLLSGVSDNVGEKYLKQFIRSGVHVYHNGNQSHKSVRCLVRYLATIYRWKPNIVFSNLFVSRFYSIFAKMIFRGTRYIDRIENTVICTGRKKYLHLLVPYFQDRTVVISPPVMKKYAEFNSNRNNHKMRLIPNGVEIPATGNQHTDFLDHGSNVSICHVGRISRNDFLIDGKDDLESAQKGQATIIRSIQKYSLLNRETSVKMYFAGEGDLLDDAMSYSNKLGVSDKVKFLGKIQSPYDLLKKCDLFIFPSRFEGMPNALIEAAVSGLPIIASNIPEHMWLIPKKGWILCDPTDDECYSNAINEMVLNLAYFKDLAKQNAKYFQNEFGIDVVAEKYLSVFREVL